MAINRGINQVIPIRVTFGGSVIAFDYRKLVNEEGDLLPYRIFSNEVPDELIKEFMLIVDKIGLIAERDLRLAEKDTLKDSLNVFNARELMTDKMKEKMLAMEAKNKKVKPK